MFSLLNTDATNIGIKQELDHISQISEGKTVYIYYSGHGYPTSEKNPSIVPQDISISMSDEYLITIEDVVERLQKGNPEKVILFTDSCFSGIKRDGEMLIASIRPVFNVKKDLKLPSNFVLLTATGHKGKSYAYKEQKQRIFTYYLAKALSGEADSDRNNQIDIDELYSYVKKNVQGTAKTMRFYDQVPDLMSEHINFIVVD